MADDITNFLPVYPNIYPIDNEIFQPYKTGFNQTLYRKKEFYDERLEQKENFPDKAGTMTKQQRLISRLFSSYTPYDEMLLVHEMGCLDPLTKIILFNGDIKYAYQIQVGDLLIGDDGESRRVISTMTGASEMYKISQSNGKNYTVNEQHILSLIMPDNFQANWSESAKTWVLQWFDRKIFRLVNKTFSCSKITKEEGFKNLQDFKQTIYYSDPIDIPLIEYVKLPESTRCLLKGFKSNKINWPFKEIDIEPYIFGMWIQTGDAFGNTFTCTNNNLLNIWETSVGIKNQLSMFEYEIGNSFEFKKSLEKYKIIGNKKIPHDYLVNNQEIRLKLLLGIIDSDSFREMQDIVLIQNSRHLAKQICFLANSLGITTTIKKEVGIDTSWYKIYLNKSNLDKVISNTGQLYSDITVTYVGVGKFVGWTLDTMTNQRFTLSDLTVTHNSGKTCVAVGAIENIRHERDGLGNSFTGAFYLAKNKELVENFVNELIFVCTDGRYIPENYDKLTIQEKKVRKNKAIHDYYKTNTFESFANELSTMSTQMMKLNYNNKIIVIDEIHHLRENDTKKGLDIYNQIHKFLHTIEGCKILLMSGTPMKNSVDEIASVMNLILPLDKQLPIGNEFIQEFFNTSQLGVHMIKPEKVQELKDAFRGKISFVKAIKSDIKKLFIGEKVGKLLHYKVAIDEMSLFQSQAYAQAYESDTKVGKNSFFVNSVQAILFVYPDGSYGNEGFTKYVNKIAKPGKSYAYTLSTELMNALRAPTHEEMLENIAKYSSKYAASIRNILLAREQKKLYFIYNRFISGSGLILFSLILELFGFSKATGLEKPGDNRSRYAAIIGLSSNNQLRSLMDRYNNPDNKNGDIIQVIMGTKKISEGFSLKNVLIEDIHTPWFNYAETEQVLARGIRFGSHKDLINSGMKKINVEIFQRVSIPKSTKIQQEGGDSVRLTKGANSPQSIDLLMYEISEIKDVSIKGVERIIRESAIDCGETYKRNFISDFDRKRPCEYQNCDYSCDGIPASMLINEQSDLDKSTYNLYYAENSMEKLIEIIKKMFRLNFRLEFGTILDNLPNNTSKFDAIMTLRTMINQSIPIINKYGFVSYLQEEMNSYFLVDSLLVSGKFKSDYYTEYPHVQQDINFQQVIEPMYAATFPINVQNLFESSTNADDINTYLLKLPLNIREFILESCILASIQEKEDNEETRNMILTYYQNYFTQFEEKWVSWLLYDTDDTVRCLQPGTVKWVDCQDEFRQTIDKFKETRVRQLEKSEYGYYGLKNKQTKDFCIRDVTVENPTKKNKQTSGKRCDNWNRAKLINLAINVLKIPIPTVLDDKIRKKWEKIDSNNAKILIKNIRASDYLEPLYTDNLLKFPIAELKRILFWGNIKVGPMCQYIEKFFMSLGPKYYVEDNTCGVSEKKKI